MRISMSDIDPRQRLMGQLDRASGLKARSASDPLYAARRAAFRAWQAERLARTHANLLDSKRFHDAAQFFLSDLYGPQDVSVHADDVRRIVPAMTRMLPGAALDTVADAIELDAMSEELDAAMIDRLGDKAMRLIANDYAVAYRAVGRQTDRARQIDLIEHLGNSLDGLTRQKFIGGALRMMRKPAEVAGLGGLQSFLERGYAAFKTMGNGSDFVAEIVGREREISAALFAGDDSVVA
jgi:hypothetical protein